MNYSVITALVFMLLRITRSWIAYEGPINGSGTTIVNGQTVYYMIATETGDWITGGDIRIGPPSSKRRLVPIINDRTKDRYGRWQNRRWEDCKIPYQFGHPSCNDPSPQMQTEILKAIEHWDHKTDGLVQLTPRTGETDFIYFCATGSVNDSPVGRQGRGQRINLAEYQPNLWSIAVHEIGHSIGFDHTHNREDRDDYISVETWNMLEKYQHNYDKAKGSTDCNQGYDYHSIMHYKGYEPAFAVRPSEPIMRPLSEFPNWGREKDFGSDSLSDSDVACAIQLCRSTMSPTSAPTNPLVITICNYDDYHEFDKSYYRKSNPTWEEQSQKYYNDYEITECKHVEELEEAERTAFANWYNNYLQNPSYNYQFFQMQKEKMERRVKDLWDDMMIYLKKQRLRNENVQTNNYQMAPNAPYNPWPRGYNRYPHVSMHFDDESDDRDSASNERSDSGEDDNAHKAIGDESAQKDAFITQLIIGGKSDQKQKDAFMAQLIIGDIIILFVVALIVTSFVWIMRQKS